MTNDEMAVTDRALPLRGVCNARDLGGLRTEDGRRVRARRVLRSDAPTELDDADLSYLLRDCGLRAVIDLRAPAEATTDGRGALGDSVPVYRNIHIFGTGSLRLDLTQVAADGSMFDRYLEYLEHSPGNIAEALNLLADADNLPALVHCAAGKDRTGVVIAILLGVIGVRADDIIADYAATAMNTEALRTRVQQSRSTREHATATPALPSWVFAAEPDTMRKLLAHLTIEHGGPTEWARRAGVDRPTQQHLTDTLLEPAHP
ncbi:tyrosine-protein phosphatase [Nocardia macrotermitis]|uniref:Tyrosine specific protein phosphatases domain-containing protein n=1 Tax=Nocardia macrotermitis TaxID=2585198 RepID=A0A7K0DCR4_9NOCA|nr:tyrosine-protein phosphatase [Nocardia macrotermitis]MQY23575.1 hypothetical protein [Nocardia macrotermitis]